MKLFEFNAKSIFKQNGIPIPEGYVAKSSTDAKDIAEKMNRPVALKSQILVGGRGKAGGIKFADNPQQAHDTSETLLGRTINGEKVKFLLVEEKANILNE